MYPGPCLFVIENYSITMGSRLRRFFQTASADDISAIETDLNNPTIKVYDITERNGHKFRELLPHAESPICEQICMKLGQKLGLGFLTSQLLSLQVKDVKKKCSKWLCAQDSVKTESGKDLYLRFRHIPTKLGCSRLKELDKRGLEYLYFQISDDFLHENLDLKSNIIKSDGLGLVTISLLIKLRLDTEQNSGNLEDLGAFLKTTDVTSFVPKSFMNDNFIDKLTLKKSIEKHLRSLHEKYPAANHSSKDLMKSYLEHILGKDVLKAHYYEESFEDGMVVSGSAMVEIGVQVDKGTSIPVIKLINKQMSNAYFTCEIKDLSSLEICQRTLEKLGSFHEVQIGHTGGVPQKVYFSSESEAKSLVSCLESFCRLTVDYYSSLCQDLVPKWYNEMSQAKVHGPSSPEYLERILRVKFNCQPDRYILYKSMMAYDEYNLIYVNSTKKIQRKSIGKVEHTERGYKLQGHDAEPERDLKTLLRKTVVNKSLVPANSIPYRPQTEVCDTIYQLLLDKPVPRLAAEDEIEADDQRKLEQQPKVFLPSDIEISQDSLMGRGYFTEVHKAVLMEEDPVVIKTLRLSEIPDKYKHLCSKSLQDAMVKQMSFTNPLKQIKFNNLSLFVGFVGIGLDSPTQMILKDTGYKNLKNFLRFREPTDTLRPQQLNDAMLNIAYALWFMEHEKLYHGNLNCSNIIIHKYDSDSHTLSVKLADPGMVTLYNQMPLDSEVNRKRVPWLSPKLFDNLSGISINTEVYAFGTTVWEMFNSGWGPLDVGQQLNGWGHEKLLEFYLSGSHLGLPVYLEEDKSDSDRVKTMKRKTFGIIKQCWELDESEMVLPERIVKDINSGIGNYGNEYHEYDVIYYADGSSSATLPLSTSSQTSGLASLVYQRQFKDVPDLSCLHAPSKIFIFHRNLVKRKPANAQKQTEEQTTQKSPVDVSHDQTGDSPLAAEPGQRPVSDRQSLPAKLNDTEQAVPKTVQQGTLVGQVRSPIQTGITGISLPKQPVPNGPPQIPLARQQSSTAAPRKPPLVKKIDHLIAEGRLKINHSCILGTGHYGAVYKGELTPSSSTGRSSPFTVAVKRLKPEMLDKYVDDFRKEIVVMQELDHENIVKFHGIYRGEQNIVMEYLEGGSLFHYVVKNKNIPQEKFLSISLDVAKGMEYLWSKKVLHMDLACRNVLLTKTQQAKVSDFGLSKALVENGKDYYRRTSGEKVIPIFWCAVEWLGQTRFTTKCDVWSFGITMWEMCSQGKKPNICKNDLEFQKEGFARLKKGERLPQPENCRPEFYQLMRDCWHDNPDNRPDFAECVDRLKTMISPQPTTAPGPSTGSDAAAPPGGSRDDKGDKQDCLQKTDSQNSESTSESDHDDYQKMTAGGDADERNAVEQKVAGNFPTGKMGEPIVSVSVSHSREETPVSYADIQTPSTGIGPSTEAQNSKDQKPVEPNTQNIAKTLDTEVRQAETSKFAYYIDEKDIVLTGECLGSGLSGKVMKGKMEEKGKGIEVAVKIFDASEDLYRRFKREMQLLGNVSHPNIVQFKGMVKGGGRTERYVMELMFCSLTKYLTETGHTDRLHTKLSFLLDIAKGMSYLAEKSILHCDLTAANILLAFDMTAKISDFGLSKRLDDDKDETGLGHYKRTDAKFKLLWSAPEVFQKEVYNRTSDIWSYGVLCLEVFLNGKPLEFSGKKSPYWESKMTDYWELIKRGERFSRPEGCPQDVYDLLKQCWSIYPEKRPKFDMIVEKMRHLQEAAHIEDLRKGQWRPI